MTFYEAAEDSIYRGMERLLSKYHNISDCVYGLQPGLYQKWFNHWLSVIHRLIPYLI